MQHGHHAEHRWRADFAHDLADIVINIIAPAAPQPPAIPSTLPTFACGNVSAITTLSENNQLKQTAPATLKIISVAAG